MPTYACKTKGCKGNIAFPEKPDLQGLGNQDPRKLKDMSLTLITDEPVECGECGTSYYESQVRS